MIINVIATGSSGNLYELIDKEGNSMLIEAGMPRGEYMKYKVSKQAPEMCIISHGHFDHCRCEGEYRAMIPVYKSQEKSISENWRAFGFQLKHGDGESTAFIIKSVVENKFVFFGTDFEFSPDYTELYTALKTLGVTNYIIECNYNDYLFHLATDDQRIGCSRHLSDNDVISFMRIVQPKDPKIILIHGSNRLMADTHTKKYIGSNLLTAKIKIAKGAKGNTKDLITL